MTNSLNRQRITTARWTTRLGALALAALLAASCGGSKPAATKPDGGDGGAPDGGGGDSISAACPTGGSGMLQIAVAGLPAGATPMIQIKGGGLTAPMVLTIGTPVTLDAGGGYDIFYRRYKTAPAAGSVVGDAYYISASTFNRCIKDGVTSMVTLTYTKEPGSAKMFMSVSNPATLGNVIAGFDGTAVATSGTKTPSVWKSKNFTGRAAAGAVDSHGDLWMPGGDRINAYAMPTLGMSSDAAPAVTLDQPANTAAKFAAFDSLGNLYVSRGAPGSTSAVVRYDATQLETSGAPTPTVTITSPDMMNPAGLAFDDLGALWVASEGNDKVLMFTAAHAGATYAGKADIAITARSGLPVVADYTSPIGLAFDKDKNLWVGYSSTLVKITVAQQSPCPTAATTGCLLNAPFAIDLATGDGFAFDESGGIWTSGPGIGAAAGQHSFQRIPTAMLTAGMATPDITIDSAELGSVDTIVINPAPTWSLLHDSM